MSAAPDKRQEVPDYREALEENVRRTVAISALRRIHRIIAEREREMRLARKWIVPIAAIVLILIAALIWLLGNPYLLKVGLTVLTPICHTAGAAAF